MQKEMKRVRKDVPWLFKGGGKDGSNNPTARGDGSAGGSGENGPPSSSRQESRAQNGDTEASDDKGYVEYDSSTLRCSRRALPVILSPCASSG